MRIKVKILFLIVTTLVLVLLIATYYTHRLVEKNHELVLREEAAKIMKQVESYIPPDGHVDDWAELDDHFRELMFLSSHLLRIDISVFREDGGLTPFVSRVKKPTNIAEPSEEELRLIKSGSMLMRLEQEEGDNYVSFMAPLHLGGKVAGITNFKISHEEFYSLLANKRKITVFVATIGILAIAGVLIISMDLMVNRPIQDLLTAISKIKEGDLSVRVAPSARDEIGKLTEHFNGMVDTLKHNTEEKEALLRQINRHNEELQEKIRVATEELVKRNEALSVANQSIYDIQKKLGHSRRLAAVGQLAAMVAHELGTPLHSVSGHLQLLMEEPDISKDAARRLSIMQSQLERITSSIQNLLDTTRQPDIHFDSLDMNRLLEDIIILMMPETISKEITVTKDFDESLPRVYGIAGRIQEVFLNLLDNAVDASNQGGAIEVTTRLAGSEDDIPPDGLSKGKWVKVLISDNGRGIPEAYIKQIFTPYYTTKAYGHGTGLGLPISQEIVKNHHGHITVKSRPGEGSAFTVYLPSMEG